ncbi:unnamed protein product [Nippostrongylus brasiliensis]|uniref:Ovule protein n=1 Tax=Nippostrongylus brasiliensis TaxID=27835 RepID=A0A0N4XNK5_NIPBR|nr:unnamed protein product [Nippostrongylus brasiliensis]
MKLSCSFRIRTPSLFHQENRSSVWLNWWELRTTRYSTPLLKELKVHSALTTAVLCIIEESQKRTHGTSHYW